MANQKDFDMRHAEGHEDGPAQGRLLRPAVAVLGHAGVQASGHAARSTTPTCTIKDGGGTFRARFGVEREEKLPDGTTRKVSLLGNGSLLARTPRSRTAIPSSRYGVLKKLGWDKRPHRAREGGDRADRRQQRRRRVLGDRPLRRHPARGDRRTAASPTATARRAPMRGTCPTRSRCIASRSTRRGPNSSPSIRRCPTRPSSACPMSASRCRRRRWKRASPSAFPLILTSGRLVEYEGGGEETRSNKWLAELQQDMFIEINPADAAERGIKDGGWVWVTGAGEQTRKARMKALVTERVGKGVTWCPFHFAGWFQGVDQRWQISARCRSDRARREREHDHDLRLRSGDRHAGTQSHALPDQGSLRRHRQWLG